MAFVEWVKASKPAPKTAQLANAQLARSLTVTHPANAGPNSGSVTDTATALPSSTAPTSAAMTLTVPTAPKQSVHPQLALAALRASAHRLCPMRARVIS